MILEIIDIGIGPKPGPEGSRCCWWIRGSYF
jgi:hypothetical protein